MEIGIGKVLTLAVIGSVIYFRNDIMNVIDEAKAQTDAAELARRTPHIIREFDSIGGHCQVFMAEIDGNNTLTTVCENAKTITDREYQQCHQTGKMTTCETKHQVIQGQ